MSSLGIFQAPLCGCSLLFNVCLSSWARTGAELPGAVVSWPTTVSLCHSQLSCSISKLAPQTAALRPPSHCLRRRARERRGCLCACVCDAHYKWDKYFRASQFLINTPTDTEERRGEIYSFSALSSVKTKQRHRD